MAALAFAGCAGKRIEQGVFHSPKGYRVTVPDGPWSALLRGAADLELRDRPGQAAMMVHASCHEPRASLDVLERHLLFGLRHRSVVSSENVSVDGRPARHAVLEARLADAGEPVKLELYVVRDGGCVYDFIYAAPPASFALREEEFRRLVASFARE
jgi:predicted Zn-dependent protease